ncbi:hypothetical protein HO173_005782 [Letharia columbiana]|uniref:Uncharacterized protein n=1 Tax=Letharia columbiana TaxID=112416 RepID=A0A8H6FWQ9_9LECA|nr:uncharacterized protein HO173_005782 [Letharia columbiana]KAF6236153.1 hypothetical protein HO173_005782 [Letharia columbiana]
MDQWLDSLSEDWVSQPASPRSTSSKQTSTLRDASSPNSNGSQSRIPRYKPRSASNLSITGRKDDGLDSSLRRANSSETALREKTSSNLNASRNRLHNGQVKLQGPGTASRKALGRQVSAESTPTVPQDTVQIKASPAKNIDGQATPDWKRRVLKENLGKGDLFSPIGLESVFKPPTIGSKQKSKPAMKKKPSKIQDFPSSPPPYPALTRQGPNTPDGDPKKPKLILSPRSELSGKEDSIYMAPQEIELPSTIGKRTERVSSANIRTSGPIPSPDAIMGRSPVLPTAPTPSQLGAYDGSSLQSASNGTNDSKISSVPEKARDENISPFYVSRHNTVDGRVEYAAIDMSMRRLRSQMDKLRTQQQNIPSSRSSDHEIDYADSRLSDRSPCLGQLDELTSQSLPDDLSMGTDAYAANGGFVSIHRGGYSNDGSFQRRPLSPSLLQDLDGPIMKSQTSITHDVVPSPKLPEMFSQTKSSMPTSPPKTPSHQKNDSAGSYERPRSSGSPLKLFDKYDTFTNDRLARRMSKFEETLQRDLQEDSSAKSVNARSSPSPGPKRRLQRSHHQQSDNGKKSQRISSFGSSDLDDHQFPAYETTGSRSQDADAPESPQSDPSDFRFERPSLDRSCGKIARDSRKFKARGKDEGDTLEQRHESRPRGARAKSTKERHHQVELGQRNVLQTNTGKRLPYSPAKDPAPKRRRTLRSSEEINQDIAQLRQQVEIKEQPVSMTGRKRKDALYNTDNQVADPNVLAMRHIRQPKLPASSPVSSAVQQTTSRISGLPPQPSPVPVHNQDGASAIDPPTQIVAGALATIALNTVQDITYGSRKASVTTADFFNEAQQIMQLIRNQGRPRSSHTTADASEVGQPTIAEESVVEDSTKDEFSRPPSREGHSPPRLRIPAQTDARVISHLRKFEEQETLGLALSSSLKTLQIGQSGKTSECSAPAHEGGDPHGGTESDPPNVRIRENNVQSHKRKHSPSTHELSILGSERQIQSKEFHSSSGPSTSRSNPTGSSHSSTNRLVIAPQTVAHLLSDQMAGMVFDRQKQLWVKRKGSANVDNDEIHDRTVSDGTEEDLFGDIPDLSVDEMEELKRVKESISSVKSSGSAVNKDSSHDQAIICEAIAKVLDISEAVGEARPRTADGKMLETVEDRSAPSKCSQSAWSGPQSGTRATSWVEEALPPKETPPVFSTDPSDQHEAEVEHEISILEGRESRVPKHQSGKHRQARVVTVAFSSPLVDQREPAHENDDDDLDLWEGQSEFDPEESPIRSAYQPSRSNSRRTSFGVVQKSGRRGTSRRMSFSNQSYHARPMSRLDEQDELSLVQYSNQGHPMTLEVAVSTPLPMSRSLMVPPTTGNRSSVSFHLSPLPDFTVHQIDKPLDSDLGQVTRRPKQSRTYQADNILSLAAQDLVKNLTDLEPYEPYWDYIRSVDLHDRELKTLHMLDEFCGGIEELDVSNNQIGELNGIPSTVRRLNIQENCLSDLAAWNSLYNLQYMDVSGNNLQSVQGFHSLVHLRALKADYNEIRSLNGLEDLDGLISLSLRGNKLRAVDLDNFNLQRLADLDLRDNELIQASNLDQLASLKTCDLSYNDLEILDISRSKPLSNLETLNISNNCLSFLEVAAMPKLKILNIDKNSIAQIEDLNCLKQLETLSWREQTLTPASSLLEIQYNDCYEVRNLFLSGNPLPEFAPSTPFLNLHHLELASTGLQSFPPDFGLQCPNVRILNGNYNAIRDLRPLLGIVKLEKLLVAGNRISRLRRTAAVLDRVGKGLLEVDLRNNPLTVGFYTPQEPAREEKRVVPHGRNSIASNDEVWSDFQNTVAYLLPAVDRAADNLSRERLDEDTKLRRRVYEMLVINGCKTLERLDGLEVDREMVGRKDGIWERLIDLGVLKAKGGEDEK